MRDNFLMFAQQLRGWTATKIQQNRAARWVKSSSKSILQLRRNFVYKFFVRAADD